MAQNLNVLEVELILLLVNFISEDSLFIRWNLDESCHTTILEKKFVLRDYSSFLLNSVDSFHNYYFSMQGTRKAMH